MKCQEQDSAWVWTDNTATPCFTTYHVAAFATALVFVPSLFVLGLVYKMFIFNSNINFADPASGLGSSGKMMFHVCRTLLLGFTVAGPLVVRCAMP